MLTIHSDQQALKFSRSELLARKDVTTLTTSEDPAFPGKEMIYRAVPAYKLLKRVKIPPGATIQFECLDGFSAPIDVSRLLNTSATGSIAYLAIEPANKKWPTIKPGVDQQTPGPFYLIWKNPKLSKIGPEEWPFQLSGFQIRESVAVRFPHILPDVSLSADNVISRGFKVFTKNCFACHTINHEGQAQMGPDLNVPMSPTEYLSDENLKKLIRNPQDMRYWPQAKMNAFPKEVISEQELADLFEYLKHMSKRKFTRPSSIH